MITTTAVAEEKKRMRVVMRKLRLIADQKEGPEGAWKVVHHFLEGLDRFGLRPGAAVAGYWPIATELDIRPLLAKLHERGFICALPVIVVSELRFRRWRPLEPLDEGERGTFHPRASEPEVTPDLVLTPGLAFAGDGARLGQGGGYYDRALARLRALKPVIAVGVGYRVQRVEKTPHAPDDARVDWIVTEAGLEQVAR